MKALIVDDEKMARAALRSILELHFPNVQVLAECQNVPEAVQQINTLRPDVIFLDIEMPEYDGFDLLKFFRPENIDFSIIFITAYSEYALQVFEISAVDYLLKPLRIEHLERALKKINPNTDAAKYKLLQENMASDTDKKLVLQTADSAFIVHLNDIIYLEAEGSYTKFFTQTHKEILVSKKMAHYEFLEKMPQFFRSHRGFLVNLNKIKRVDKKNFTIEMLDGNEVYLAQDRKNELLQKISS